LCEVGTDAGGEQESREDPEDNQELHCEPP